MVHLHVHSHFSLLEGVPKIQQLVAKAVEYGMRSLALTDTGGLYGAIPFYKAARDAGINPIIGVYLDDMIFLARDRDGYSELCELVTDYQVHKIDPISRMPSDHLFVMTSDRKRIEALCANAMQPLVAITHYGGPSRYQAQRLLDFARARRLRPVAVNPVYFLDPSQEKIHRVLSAIRLNKTIDTLDAHETAPPGAWFRSPDEMAKLYGEWPETVENAQWVAEQCHLELQLGTPLFPQCDLPQDETPFSFLWKRAFEGVNTRYKNLTPQIVERLHRELDVIYRLGFAPYFLIVWDIVQHAVALDIPIVGRGSAANSLVAYALGITRVDPFKYDLYFERFLNPSRTDCPDIDLDICWRRRDEVIDYVYKKYGDERVAMICTFNTFQARSALRDVAKTFGLTEDEINDIVRQLPHYKASDVRTVVKFLPECRYLRLDQEPLKSILEISEQLDAYPRHLSIHSGGLVIAPEPLTHFVPLQRSTKGILITQYDMHPIEDLGLIKMDLLGHRSLTVIQETVNMVRENRGIMLDIEHLPDPDPLTADLIRNGRTIGCFQIESPAMRALLKATRADSTDMLIKTLSLVRPGPSGSGMKKHFIDRHRGLEETVHLHPSLETVLGDTYGVMLYQEDILKVAHVIAGLTLGEADGLRRAMTKKRSPHEMAKSMKGFIEKAIANGVAEQQAEEIWGLMSNFAEYSYCKAHASTYGELSYQCTYLKAHFPAEFMAGVLSNRGGFYHPAVYIEEARRCGVRIIPPAVNKSRFEYSVEDMSIRMGFVEIRNLTHSAVQGLLAARKAAPFESFCDLCQRAHLTYADADILIQSGACDELGHTRPEMLWELKMLHAKTSKPSQNNTPAQSELSVISQAHVHPQLPSLPDYSLKKCVDLEWTSLSMPLSVSPIGHYVSELAGHLEGQLVLSTDMASYSGHRVRMVGWVIAERRVGLKGKGCMKFLTCEDPEGVFEAVLFPAAYQQFGHLLTSQGPFFISGDIQEENGYHTLIVTALERPGSAASTSPISKVTPPLHWMFSTGQRK